MLDEATSSIDSKTDQILIQAMKEYFTDRTVVTAAHRPDTILDADVVAILDGGKLVEFGRPDELMKGDSRLKGLLKHAHLQEKKVYWNGFLVRRWP